MIVRNTYLTLLLTALCFSLLSCQLDNVKDNSDPKRKITSFEQLDADYTEARLRAHLASKWHEDYHQPLPLHLIGPVFDHPESVKHDAYKLLTISLNTISKNPNVLNSTFGADFSKRFIKVKHSKFSLNSSLVEHVSAVFSHSRRNEVTLNAIFDAMQSKGLEMAVGFDEQAIKQNKLILFGYKTVKEQGFDRSSAYFEINAGDWPKGRKKRLSLIFRSLSAALALSIPEYASVDRKKILDVMRTNFITEFNNQNTYGHIYRNRLKELELDRRHQLITIDKSKVILKTESAVDFAVASSGDYIAYANKHQYKSKVWLGSASNLEQRNKIIEQDVWDGFTRKVFFTPDDSLILIDSNAIRRYQPASSKWKYHIKTDDHLDGAIDAKGKVIAVIGQDKLKIYNAVTGKRVANYDFEDSNITNFALNPNGRIALIVQNNGNLSRVNTSTGKVLSKANANSPVTAITYNPKGTKAFIALEDGRLFLWNELDELPMIFTKVSDAVTRLQVNHAGTQLAARTVKGEVIQWKASINKAYELGRFNEKDLSEADILDGSSVLAYSVDDKKIYHGGVVNLHVRSSETSNMINNRFDALAKIIAKKTWLDASSAYQLIYPDPLTANDIYRLQQSKLVKGVNGERPIDRKSTLELLSVVGMELPDPMLVGSLPTLFKKSLNLESVTNETDLLKIIRYKNNNVDSVIAISRPLYDQWGYR
jgi:hypothetical protein